MSRHDTLLVTAALAAILLSSGCAGSAAHRWPWDHDRPVMPLRERAAAPADTGPAYARSYVILLPDEEGRVDVASAAGVATLSEAGQAADLGTPGRPFDLSDEEVRRTFDRAFAGEPQAAGSYVVFFRIDSTEMVSRSLQEWEGIAAAIVGRPAPELSLAGYADRAGSEAYNEGLSQRRAQRVRELLIKAGVPVDWIETRWYGETRPAVPTADGVHEERNRRVEIRVR